MASSPKKAGLSSGLMSLKFMQRGPAVEVEATPSRTVVQRAVVQEDGRWEIGKDVRQSWGMDSDALQNVTYEESYLPFLTPEFASISSTPAAAAGGRRSFGRFNKALEPKPVEEEQTADMIPEPSTPGSIPADDLPMPRKLVVKPEPLISAENLRTPNPLKAPRQKTQWDHESKYPHVARQERPGSAKPHGAERDGAAKHPAQPAFQKPKGVDAPTAAESKSNGKKRRQDERDSDTILESRRAKKQKKQKQKKPAEE